MLSFTLKKGEVMAFSDIRNGLSVPLSIGDQWVTLLLAGHTLKPGYGIITECGFSWFTILVRQENEYSLVKVD